MVAKQIFSTTATLAEMTICNMAFERWDCGCQLTLGEQIS
jgi:hypothetical protein